MFGNEVTLQIIPRNEILRNNNLFKVTDILNFALKRIPNY